MKEYTFFDKIKHGWNAFRSRDPTEEIRTVYTYESPSYYRPDRHILKRTNERSTVNALYNRIALDVSSIEVKHVRLNDNGQFIEEMDTGLNNCLTLEANIDQSSRAFIQDIVQSMLDEGVVAVVPVDTSLDPEVSNSYDILTMRVGKITQWYPRHVQVLLYNDRTGKKEHIIFEKSNVAIIENPLYTVINEPNSTMQRLIRKLLLLDSIDEQIGSSKLDLIIQLPYIIKTEARRKQAEIRRKEIEDQLRGSQYGIAYTDGTEKITQLNRPVENNLLKQIEYLTDLLYSQLGITKEILDGTANEQTMLNYYNRTVEPIISAIVLEMKRKFLTKTARTQKQSIIFIRDPFKLTPINSIAEIADKFTRNEIASSNEIRGIIGWKPSNDPRSDQLLNKNINHPTEESNQRVSLNTNKPLNEKEADKNQNG